MFEKKPTDTLITKIMLGVFGNVPAFDTFFCKGFKVDYFGRNALKKIGEFYNDNNEIIEKSRLNTLDFHTGQRTTRLYTRAKMIDMIFFTEGSNK